MQETEQVGDKILKTSNMDMVHDHDSVYIFRIWKESSV